MVSTSSSASSAVSADGTTVLPETPVGCVHAVIACKYSVDSGGSEVFCDFGTSASERSMLAAQPAECRDARADDSLPCSSGEFPLTIEVIRSARRKRTASSEMRGNALVVRIPDALTQEQEKKCVADFVRRAQKHVALIYPSNADLCERSRMLNAKYLEGRACPVDIRWTHNQLRRWGSCTVHSGKIRISHRLCGVPDYVLNAVLIHELIHTFVPGGHGREFQQWESRTPKLERARGFLEAMSYYDINARNPENTGE